jgi:beta-glucanase (GH16 family)
MCLGVDVTANQEEISDFETFQLEWEPNTASWYIRTMQVSFKCDQNHAGQLNFHQNNAGQL